MEWLAWIVLAALAIATVVCGSCADSIRENSRIDGMIRDFDRENPRHEPGSRRPRGGWRAIAAAGRRCFGGRAGHRLSCRQLPTPNLRGETPQEEL